MQAKRSNLSILFIIAFIAFALLVTVVFVASEMKKAESLDSYTSETIHYFYAEEPDSLDGIYLGSSAAYRYWAPAEAFQKEGICIYNLGTYIQPFVVTKYLIEEALKSQTDMKVIVVEVRNLVRPSGAYNDDDFKRVSDVLPYSSNRSAMIEAYLDYCKAIGAEIDCNSVNYHVPFLRDGADWLEEYDLSALRDLYNDDRIEHDKGFNGSYEVKAVAVPPEYTERAPLTDPQEDLLRDLLQYCKSIKPEVVFVSAPFSSLSGKEGMIRTALDICEEEGFATLDFNCDPLQEQIGMDWSTDFYNYKHTNWYGAKKYTDFLAAYLADKYELEDHWQEPGYESWHEAIETLGQ